MVRWSSFQFSPEQIYTSVGSAYCRVKVPWMYSSMRFHGAWVLHLCHAFFPRWVFLAWILGLVNHENVPTPKTLDFVMVFFFEKHNSRPDLTSRWHPQSQAHWQRACRSFTCSALGLKPGTNCGVYNLYPWGFVMVFDIWLFDRIMLLRAM
jgi:hypothetical protein